MPFTMIVGDPLRSPSGPAVDRHTSRQVAGSPAASSAARRLTLAASADGQSASYTSAAWSICTLRQAASRGEVPGPAPIPATSRWVAQPAGNFAPPLALAEA